MSMVNTVLVLRFSGVGRTLRKTGEECGTPPGDNSGAVGEVSCGRVSGGFG